jgi:hypothetical protein
MTAGYLGKPLSQVLGTKAGEALIVIGPPKVSWLTNFNHQPEKHSHLK